MVQAAPAKDKYKKLKKLGEGAFGQAVLVQSQTTQKLWVIKQVDLTHMTSEERHKARDESKILEVLNHPNIIQFKDVFKDRKKMSLNVVMEYADDGELADKIRERRQLGQSFTEDEILNFFTQICLALKHCHDRKILHRDLKPNNVFLTRTGICKLGDFGISRVLHGTRSKAHSIVGTPLYLSPEILKRQGYNMKTDIWALGTLLYEMAALRPPWQESNLVMLGVHICQSKYPPLPDHYSFALKNIVQMCMQKDPNRRPSINSILKLPVIQRRIENYLNTDLFKKEFAHTLLHNQNVFEEFNKIKERLADQSAVNAQPESEPTVNESSMFHPPDDYLQSGGHQDLYVHEMRKLVHGVELDSNQEVAQIENEQDGIELMASQNSQVSQTTVLNKAEIIEKTSDWTVFEPYMQQVFGADVFAQGYAIIQQHHEQAFVHEGNVALRQQLSALIPDDVLCNDFINICLTQIIAEPMPDGAFVSNLNEETRAMLQGQVLVDDL